MSQKSFKIAAVQASSVFLDKEATVEKACRLISEAAGEGAQLVVFPEAFIPGYPLRGPADEEASHSQPDEPADEGGNTR